jgi:hypothetical protein
MEQLAPPTPQAQMAEIMVAAVEDLLVWVAWVQSV